MKLKKEDFKSRNRNWKDLKKKEILTNQNIFVYHELTYNESNLGIKIV